MATPDEVTKALLEIRKSCVEITITATTAQAHIKAVEATINAMGTRLQEILAENLAAEESKLLATRADLQNDVRTIQKAIEMIDARIMPQGPIN